MRTILLASLAALGACASTPEPAPTPMTSARAASLADGGVPSTAAACLTRYSYRWLDVQFDCPTEHVGGDPDHWVTSCAVPAGFGSLTPLDLHGLGAPPLRYEATSEAGLLLHEVIDLLPGQSLGYVPEHDVSYVYDAQQRLAERIASDVNGVEIDHLVVGPRDAAGNPQSMALTTLPLVVYGVTYPATAHVATVYGYDADGRLVTDHKTFSDGVAFYDETIHYDDAALRRDRVVIVDVSGEIHETGPGYNTTHELTDAEGRLRELDHTTAGDVAPSVLTYHYDDRSRLTSTIATRDGFTETVDYIYECP